MRIIEKSVYSFEEGLKQNIKESYKQKKIISRIKLA